MNPTSEDINILSNSSNIKFNNRYQSDSKTKSFLSKNLPTILFGLLVLIIALILFSSSILMYFFYKEPTFSPSTEFFEKINKYVHDCTNGISYNNINFPEPISDPQISIIIPVYNAPKYIDIAYKSIINQSFKKIEIIFINDFPNSKDNEIIEKIQKNDKRVILIKNKENRGSFYSRNTGALKAKGKYIQFLDVDDLLINDILKKTYEKAEKNNLDIVQYPYISTYDISNNHVTNLRTTNGIIFQPELKNVMFRRNDRYYLHKTMLWDKLIKKEIFEKALSEFITDKYLNEKFACGEDTLTFYAIINVAKSYIYIDDPGYIYHVGIKGGITSTRQEINKSNDNLKSTFLIVKIVYEKAEDNREDKIKSLSFFRTFNSFFWSGYEKIIIDKDTDKIVKEVFDILLKDKYYKEDEKKYINKTQDNIYKKIKKSTEKKEGEKY